MTYKEKIQLYREGKLDQSQARELEKDIEKFNAISDYIVESDPLLDEEFGLAGDGSPFADGPESAKDDGEDLTKKINSSIRRAFIKTGAIAAAAAIIITLLVMYIIPGILYYNASKSVGSDENGDAIPVMEQDLKAYGEITMPELGPNLHVDVDKHGQGDYTFYTDASYSACGTDINKNFNGAVSRSICTVYDPKVIADFAVFSPEIWQAGTPVGSMKDGATYFAYALLKDPMSYDEFFGDYGQNDEYGTNASWLWAATSVSEDDTEGAHKSLGFFADTGATEGEAMVFDTEKAARDHFGGLLSYIAESGKFAELRGSIWVEGEPYAEYAKFVRDEGLSVYGFVYVSDKEHIEKLVESEDIAKVSVREV